MSSLPATTHNSISNAWREGSALQRNAGTIGIRIYQLLLCVRLAVVVDRHLLYVRYGTDRRHNRRIGWQQMVPVPVLLVVRTCNGTTVPTTQVSCRCQKNITNFFCYILTFLTFLFSDTDFFCCRKYRYLLKPSMQSSGSGSGSASRENSRSRSQKSSGIGQKVMENFI